MLVDHRDPSNHDRPLWCIYGPKCFPTIFCCKLESKLHGYTVIWGYSVYRRQPGFRTLGQNVETWMSDHREKYGGDRMFEFYDDHNEAILRIAQLTAPSPKAM